MDAATDAVRAVAAVAADGTDPAALLAVLAWAVRPRRTPDALRRRCREDGVAGPEDAAATLAEVAGPAGADVLVSAVELAQVWRGLGVRVALVGDPAYPARLAAGWPDLDAPTLLAWRGTPPADTPAVAIVGARRATGYGAGVAAWLAEAAARAGARVVSGGAQGVDAAAHQASLEEPGGTTVVLGCGHAVAYPRDHARDGGLFDRIVAHGGTLVSELLPFQAVHPGTVRARNRIVAGLADVVIVVEGRERSGALLTATAAAERGRTVLAVPGDVRAAGSAAPHRLLAEGAAPCTGPADLLLSLDGVSGPGAGQVGSGAGPDVDPGAGASAGVGAAVDAVLPAAARQVLADAWPRPVRSDDLARLAALPPGRLLAALTRARVAGLIAETADGVRLRRPPA